jgi:hypothetical protein
MNVPFALQPAPGDTITSTTESYPGTTSEPAALTAQLTAYKQLSQKFDVTVDTVKRLSKITNAASDKAAVPRQLGVSLGFSANLSCL